MLTEASLVSRELDMIESSPHFHGLGKPESFSNSMITSGERSREDKGRTYSVRITSGYNLHRVEFGEVSGHRVLIKRGPGNRGPTECGTTHEATSGMSS